MTILTGAVSTYSENSKAWPEVQGNKDKNIEFIKPKRFQTQRKEYPFPGPSRGLNTYIVILAWEKNIAHRWAFILLPRRNLQNSIS